MLGILTPLITGTAMTVAVGASAPEMLQKHLEPELAAQTDRVEVVYSDGAFSHLEYASDEVRILQPHRPTGEIHRIPSPRLTPFGNCARGTGGSLQRRGAGACGFILDLGVAKAPLDLLDFQTLGLGGTVTGRWTVALADERLAAMEDNRPLGQLQGGGTMTWPLTGGAQSLDLKRSRLLIFILQSPAGSLSLSQVEFRRAAATPAPLHKPAIWVWDSRPLRADGAAVAAELAGRSIRRVYLQINDDLPPLRPFLRHCRERQIEVYALDGSPDYVFHSEPLLERARMVRQFNRTYPDTPFAGFQIDVEPHLNKDFRLRSRDYGLGYIRLLDALNEALGRDIPLSSVIPFWYDSLLVDNQSLTWHVMVRSAEAVIMGYRTTLAEIEAIVRDELAYGERLGKPVLLGVETVTIPDELHVTYARCAAGTPDAVSAGQGVWCRRNEYTVPGSKISFAGKEERYRELLQQTLPSPAFAGWVIHSYESAPQ